MPYLISYSFKPIRRSPSGRVDHYDVAQAMVATTRSPGAFVLAVREKFLAMEKGQLPADQWSADDIQALLSVVEISDDEYVKLNDVL